MIKKTSASKATYRKKTRELLLRILFQMESTGDFSGMAKDFFLADTSLYIGDVSEDTPLGCIFDEAAGETPDLPYLNWGFACVRDHLTEINAVLEDVSEKWSVKRMGIVDLSILRVALAEILYMDGIDIGTSANEAVLLAKKYSTEKSAAFINGILGTIIRTKDGADR